MLRKRGKVITKHGCKLARPATRCASARFPTALRSLPYRAGELELTSHTTFFCMHPTVRSPPFRLILQPYTTSVTTSFSSGGRSRTSSLASQQSGSIQLSALSSPNSPFFPGPLPSPFREQSASFSSQASATIDPSAVRNSSPSATSSSSVVTHSRADSTASSPPESTFSSSTAPRRAGSISSRASGRSNTLKHTRKNSNAASPTKNFSPTKGNRSGRRLTNAQRREICLYQRAHPNMKQDDIGRVFNYERSTISKTLKEKEHWLSDRWEEPEPNNRKKLGGHRNKSRSVSAHPSSDHEYDSAGERTPNLSAITPQGSPESPPFPTKGRYPAVDKALNAWAHEQAPLGTILTDAVLQAQAKTFASTMRGYEAFKASHTWLEGFKARAGIRDGALIDADGKATASAPLMSTHNSRQSISLDDVVGSSSVALAEEDSHAAADGAEHADYGVEAEAVIRRSTRQKRPTQASKSLHRLASSQSSFSFDHSRANSPVPRAPSDVYGGSFGDISMESESTPTHSTVHSRVATGGSLQPLTLAGPYSYSPTSRHGDDSNGSTPSRLVNAGAPGSLVLEDHSPSGHRATYQEHQPQYSYTSEVEPSTFVPPYELTAFQPPPFGSLSTSSSQSSLANFDLGTSTSSLLPPADYNASPAPSFNHHRSGSTASSTSIYSGLTAFSSANGNGTPLTGSAYGSFRTSPGDSCSMPSTPAHGSYFEPSQIPSFAPSPLQQQPMFSSHTQNNDSTHQRYPTQQSLEHSTSSSTSTSPARRATISGGAPFQGRSSTSGSTSTSTPAPASSTPAPIQGSVSLDEAYASLKVALSFLGVNEGFARPGDFVTFGDIMSKMEDRRAVAPQGVSPAVLSAPPSTLSSPFQSQPAHPQPFSNIPNRLKLTRTQSASSVPVYGGGGWVGGSTAQHRSKNSISLAEVDGH